MKDFKGIFLKIILLASVLFAIAGVAYKIHGGKNASSDISIEQTVAEIESSRPTGILYLSAIITEDYVKSSFWGSGIGSSVFGKNNGILKKKHDCVQILKQQISLTMNMDSVKYRPLESTDTVYVTLPDVEFMQSTVGSWFHSDDENEEGKVEFGAAPLISRVEKKIYSRYNTPENIEKAREHAEVTISAFLKQFGKVAVFE